MDLIIEQAKQYFIGKNYEKAYKAVEENRSSIPKEKMALALDIAACSYFMARDYDTANIIFAEAIEQNPTNADFYISRGAALRCLGNDDQSIEILEKAASIATDPAINYNLRILSKNNLEISAQTQLISEHEEYNRDYDKYDGIVPSFLKLETARSDYILDKEKQIIKQISLPIQDQTNWSEHLKKISDLIEIRQIQKNNYGVELTEISKQVFPAISKMIKIYEDINKKIRIQTQREQLLKRTLQLIKMIKADQSIAKIISENQQISDQIKLKQQKQLNFYKNLESFNEAKIKNKSLCQRVYRINSSGSDIHVIITEDNYLAYISMDLIRSLMPKRTIKQLEEVAQKDAKFVFNLYWFVCLKILLNSEQGMSLSQFLQYRQAIMFIYRQIDDADNYKLQEDQLLKSSIYIIHKYNELFTTNFINKEKKTIIYKNCQFFKNYLQQIDLTFESILKKKVYVDLLTNQITSSKDQEYFRDHYKLADTLNDNIAQTLMVIFYHFREPCKPHQLLVKAMAEMTLEGIETLNGRDSFYKNFYESIHPPKTLLQKVWKKLSQS